MTTENTTNITNRRTLTVARAGGEVRWTVDEFDNGRAYVLTAAANWGAVHFSAHFTEEQWAEFQNLIDGVTA